jgi:hypothetical protein
MGAHNDEMAEQTAEWMFLPTDIAGGVGTVPLVRLDRRNALSTPVCGEVPR